MKDVILRDVIDYILKCTDSDKLIQINELLKDRLKTISSKLKSQLKPGDKVRITGTGKFEHGVIRKVNRTKAVVEVEMADNLTALYTVPFTMITKEVSNG